MKKTFLKSMILGSVMVSLTGCSLLGNNSSDTSQGASSAVTSQTSESSEASQSTVTAYFTEADKDSSYNASSASTITLSGSSAKVSGDGVSVSDSVVTISSAGTYVISGESDGVQILVDATDDAQIQLVLDNVSMTGTDALIAVLGADQVKITSPEGTSNTIEDSADRTAEDYSAAIYSKKDLVFNGTGTLTVTGNYNNAIKGNDDIKFTEGNYVIESTVKHAVSANDNLYVTNVTMNLTSVKSALYADNDEDTSLGNLYVESGNFTINAGKKGLHASNELTIDGGTIDVQSSYEGIEAKVITINDGDITLVASDDGMNATDWASTAGEMQAQDGVSLNINGGKINVTADGDGLDSNNAINISGGTVYVNGPTGNGDAAFDYDGKATITGGTLLAIGSSGMAQAINGESSTQMSFQAEVSGSEGDEIVVTDSSGNTVFTYTAKRDFANIVLSNEQLKDGETYTISVNGSEAGTATAAVTSDTGMGMGGGPGGGGAPSGDMPGDMNQSSDDSSDSDSAAE